MSDEYDEIDYDIVYTIRRRLPGEEDFSEIGFGAAMGSTPDEAFCFAASDVQGFNWEIEEGMPDPEEIRREIEEGGDRD